MNPRFWSFRMFAALWGMLLAPVLPTLANTGDIAELAPADALAYVGWSKVYEEGDPEIKQAVRIAQQFAMFDSPEDSFPGVSIIMELIAAAMQSPGALALQDFGVRDGNPDVQISAILAAGAKSKKISDDFTRFVSAVSPESEIETAQIGSTSLSAVKLPAPGMRAYWGECGSHFVITIGRTAAEKAVALTSGSGKSITNDSELGFVRSKLGLSGGGAQFQAFLKISDIMVKIRDLAKKDETPLSPFVERVLEALGVNTLRSAYVDTRESDIGGVTRAFLHVEGEQKGLLKLWDQKPLTRDDLKVAPKNAYWAKVANFDLAKLWNDSRDTIEDIDPNALPMVEGALAMAGSFLGFSLTDQVLPAFGDTWAVFDAPDHGGILLTGTTLVVETRDADAIASALARVVELLKPMLAQEDINLSLRQSEINGRTIHTAVIGGIPCPVAPSWTFVDGWMVFGLFPQTVAVAAQQVDSKTRGPCILEEPAVAAALKGDLSGDFRWFGYADAQYFARLIYPLGLLWTTAGVSMASQPGIDLDPALYPVLAEAVKDVHNAIITGTADGDGIYYAQVGSANAALLGVAVAALAVSILLPSLSRSRELAKRAVSASSLRAIGEVCHFYANSHAGNFPDNLDILVDEGTICRETLNSPRDYEGAESYVYISGQSQSDDARNVLAYERIIGDEGTNVLYLDKRVRWISIEEFKQELLQTYQRLGREDEMPVELRP